MPYLTPKEVEEKFEEYFYEGDRNSVHCKEHNVYATPFEIKNFIHQQRIQDLESEIEWLEGRKNNELYGVKVIVSEHKDLTDRECEMFTYGFNKALEATISHKQQLLQALKK